MTKINQGNGSLIILASQSPRRKELLEKAGVSFTVVFSSVDEDKYCPSDPKAYAKLLAEAKAEDVSVRYPDSWIIGADSIVVIDGNILQKPGTVPDARRMLEMLSGKRHHVYTGYAIFCRNKSYFFSDVESTAVLFKQLSEQEIEWYIHTPEPYDKAGGYAAQDLGSFMIKRITGSYTNVVGLPICEVIDHLIKLKVIHRDLASSPANFKLSGAHK